MSWPCIAAARLRSSGSEDTHQEPVQRPVIFTPDSLQGWNADLLLNALPIRLSCAHPRIWYMNILSTHLALCAFIIHTCRKIMIYNAIIRVSRRSSLFSLVPVKVPFRIFFLGTVTSVLLIKDLNIHPDCCKAALWQCHLSSWVESFFFWSIVSNTEPKYTSCSCRQLDPFKMTWVVQLIHRAVNQHYCAQNTSDMTLAHRKPNIYGSRQFNSVQLSGEFQMISSGEFEHFNCWNIIYEI